MRGMHPEYVFTHKGRPVKKMYGAARPEARSRAGLPQVRVHDLKHRFGRRLRAAGVSSKDRQGLLGHTSGVSPHTTRRQNWKISSPRQTGFASKSPALVVLERKSA